MATANPHLRAIVLAGALAAVAVLLGGYTLSKRAAGVDTSAPVPAVTHPAARHAATTAAKPKTAAKTAAKPKAPVKAAAKPKAAAAAAPAQPKAPAGPAPVVRAALAYGLPKTVARQFETHEVVVVSLYSSEDDVDVTSEAEAAAGAELAGSGFQAVDTTEEGASGLVTKLLGVVDAPAVLVFQRPDAAAVQAFAAAQAAAPAPSRTTANAGPTPPTFPLFVRLQGFNDRETVAQAAWNADPTPGGPAVQSAWARQADAVCAGASKQLEAIGPLKKPADVKKATPKYAAVGKSYLASLGALKAPAGRADDVARFVALQQQDVALTTKLMTATGTGDTAAMATLSVQESQVARQASALATQLGAAGCSRGL